MTELGVIPSEKGPDNSASEAGWAAGSLFAFIDSCGSASKLADDMRFDVLVCDDGGTEIADFIGLDLTNGRVVAIHAKAFKVAKPLSASALQEVSAQALKNLGFLQPYPYGTPPNLQRWSRPWRSRAGRVTSRVRRGSGTPNHLWNQFREALIDPQVTREVWIMMGQGPSQARLREESRKAQPKAEVIQMLFSLQATWGAVSSVGARLPRPVISLIGSRVAVVPGHLCWWLQIRHFGNERGAATARAIWSATYENVLKFPSTARWAST